MFGQDLGVVVRLFSTVVALRCYLELQSEGQTVGLVPTMGALHAGHLSLIGRARASNDIVVVSIFVNPLQFGPNEDLLRYPRTLEGDRRLCEQAGVDIIFAPTPEEMGIGEGTENCLTQVVPPQSMMSGLCGRSRPGHFQGVATIVTKLFNVVQPDRAYFGRKDAQQLAILQRMVRDLNLPVEIVPCEIVRETSGLAMSSRNQYLSEAEKACAAVLYRSLQKARKVFFTGEVTRQGIIAAVQAELDLEPDVNLEYCELVEPTSLKPIEQIESAGLVAIAARIGNTRLIDNIILKDRQPIVAIDGPAGAGKSTVARRVAKQLGLMYLDTGAMYRAITWLVQEKGISFDDEPAIAEVVSRAKIEFIETSQDPAIPTQVWVDGSNVTEAIRTQAVTAHVSQVSSLPSVRLHLVKQQQQFGERGGVVAEGRDIGTHVFPDAELKIFLTASVGERARRRQQDLTNVGDEGITLEQIEGQIALRDRLDSTRQISPLTKAENAIEIDTDHRTIDEVIAEIVQHYATVIGAKFGE
ncbi:bifunctional pantoate--beta-alanine ligase/(d)CMP kinase [Laspinema olomoucense]|uniref:bifunctional pantoate--beta-alanine ligase/(d)CMP kinase n=1 Tax=Laspinema olomoucense TaxID=3231600 RepID=UPI0021BA88AE|nr:bifunctional pantoate--beta-alanine ligase/(d)CMP kinase [Laspinema sp. D3a]MCT7988192.1 bifunctional pantoate--beta-alanine ligase/(d)CMP kinase [Laspinema sp. D3a]